MHHEDEEADKMLEELERIGRLHVPGYFIFMDATTVVFPMEPDSDDVQPDIVIGN